MPKKQTYLFQLYNTPNSTGGDEKLKYSTSLLVIQNNIRCHSGRSDNGDNVNKILQWTYLIIIIIITTNDCRQFVT